MSWEQDDRDVPGEEHEYLCDVCGDTGWALQLAPDGTCWTKPCRKCLTQPEADAMERRLPC